jgi:hypothetical protein
MNKYDLYIGKSIMCCCGSNCRKKYEVMSKVYEDNDGDEVFDLKDESSGEITKGYVDYLDEYIEY